MQKQLLTASIIKSVLYIRLLFFSIPLWSNSRGVADSINLHEVHVSEDANLSKIFGKGKSNTHYIFRYTHDLSRYTEGLIIGENCILEFKRGGFINGKIKCGSIIIEGKSPRFTNAYIEIDNADYAKIKNINADYTFAVDDFVKITNSKNIDVENVKVTFDKGNRRLSDGGDWIYTEGFDLIDCSNVSFKECVILNAKSRNVDSEHGSLTCKNCYDISVDGCSSSGGYNEAFLFMDCNNVTIKNTIISGGNGSGITLIGGENFVIDECKSINVGASGFSLNAKKIRVTNCLIKNWQAYGGVTLGHSLEVTRTADVEVSNCTIVNDSGKGHPDPIWAFGGVSEGVIKIHDCKIKSPRICTFDFIYNGEPLKLDLRNNYINVIKAEGLAATIECFRASGNYDLLVENNTFVGGVGITGYVRPSDNQPVSNWRIKGNTFKRLGKMPIITPRTKENISMGLFEFSDNVIETLESVHNLIVVPHYRKVVVDGNKNKNGIL